MNTERARNTKVNFGSVEMEWLLLPDGSFRVRAKEVGRLILANQNHETRDLKALLGKGSELSKVKTENNNNPETTLTKDQFFEVIKIAASRGNAKASKLMADLFGLAVEQLLADAFGIKFEKEQRVAWLEARQESKREFRTLTDAFQRVLGFTRSEEYQAGVAQFQTALDICNGCRDILDETKLKKLSRAEVTASALLDAGMPWGEVLGLLTKMR